jgi:hypothetical protein
VRILTLWARGCLFPSVGSIHFEGCLCLLDMVPTDIVVHGLIMTPIN